VAKWKTVSLPDDVWRTICELSEKLGLPRWKVVARSAQFFAFQLKKPKLKKELPAVDKVAWYAVKVAMSVGRLKENPTEENFNKLLETLSQVQDRMGVDASWVARAAKDFLDRKDADSSMELNAALKNLVVALLLAAVEYEAAKEVELLGQ